MIKSVSFAFLLILCVSCNNESSRNFDAEKQLVGEWRNVSLKLTMNSYKGGDSLKVFEVKEGEWEKKMGILPIRTFFRADGSYNSEHRNLKDSIIYNPAGKWEVRGDIIVMTDTFPEKGLSYRYKVVVDNDIAEFSGLEDCDHDGVPDDNYEGRQRRQK